MVAIVKLNRQLNSKSQLTSNQNKTDLIKLTKFDSFSSNLQLMYVMTVTLQDALISYFSSKGIIKRGMF